MLMLKWIKQLLNTRIYPRPLSPQSMSTQDRLIYYFGFSITAHAIGLCVGSIGMAHGKFIPWLGLATSLIFIIWGFRLWGGRYSQADFESLGMSRSRYCETENWFTFLCPCGWEDCWSWKSTWAMATVSEMESRGWRRIDGIWNCPACLGKCTPVQVRTQWIGAFKKINMDSE